MNLSILSFCNLGCGISLIFIIGMIYMILSVDKSNLNAKFKSLLNPIQTRKYMNIINERKNIYFMGYIFGFILSLMIIVFNLTFLKKKMNNVSMIYLTGGISFLTTYFYYILSKKSDYMILHLNSKDQRTEWLKIYKTMQFNYHFGLVLGIISVMCLSVSVC
jgi:hypothetical protein